MVRDINLFEKYHTLHCQRIAKVHYSLFRFMCKKLQIFTHSSVSEGIVTWEVCGKDPLERPAMRDNGTQRRLAQIPRRAATTMVRSMVVLEMKPLSAFMARHEFGSLDNMSILQLSVFTPSFRRVDDSYRFKMDTPPFRLLQSILEKLSTFCFSIHI